MAGIFPQSPLMATSEPDELSVAHLGGLSMSDQLTFQTSGRFMNSAGESRLASGWFAGSASYRQIGGWQDVHRPTYGRYELNAWAFDFFDSQDEFIGTMSSESQHSTASWYLNRQAIAIVRPSCVFLRVDGCLDFLTGVSGWTLRLLFALPNDETCLQDALSDAVVVSGETRPIRSDANMPVPTGERLAIAAATIRLYTPQRLPRVGIPTGSSIC